MSILKFCYSVRIMDASREEVKFDLVHFLRCCRKSREEAMCYVRLREDCKVTLSASKLVCRHHFSTNIQYHMLNLNVKNNNIDV